MTITTSADRARAAGLDDREVLVLGMVAIGRTNAYIGEKLSLTEGSIDKITRRIYSKLGVSGRVTAAGWWYGGPAV